MVVVVGRGEVIDAGLMVGRRARMAAVVLVPSVAVVEVTVEEEPDEIRRGRMIF